MATENPNANCTNEIQANQCERLCNFEIVIRNHYMLYLAVALNTTMHGLSAPGGECQTTQTSLAVSQQHSRRRDVDYTCATHVVTRTDNPAVDDRQLAVG
jgi:hypothetical protein